jgi:hypothetical protein
MHTKPIPSVVFRTKEFSGSLDALNHLPGVISLEPDEPYAGRFEVTAIEMQRILASMKPIAGHPAMGKGEELMSFAIVRETGSDVEGYELRVQSDDGERFYRAVMNSLDRDNKVGRNLLLEQFHRIGPSSNR